MGQGNSNLHDNTKNRTVTARSGGAEFCSNYVRTTKYTLLTFLPRNLFEQFRRVANLYFLIMASLATIPQISPINPGTSWAPLIFVFCVTAFREAFEDYKRYRSDVEMNSREVQAVRGNKFEAVKWEHIRVGDIVKISKNRPARKTNPNDKESSFFPGDILLLNSSEVAGEDNHPAGICFIETKDLDGETNLKTKKVAQGTVNMSEEQLGSLQCRVECSPPTAQLDGFSGVLNMSDGSNERVNFENLLLRGSNVKNSEWVVGMVLYTGNDTKVMRNMNKEAPSKRSRIEIMMNRLIFGIFALLVSCCVAGAIGGGIFVSNNKDSWYFTPSYETPTFNTGNTPLSGFILYFTFFILLSQMVPISLYVQVEIVKTFFAILVSWDLSLYGVKVDTPAKANTSNLGEELGQVEYIFSDKTGTLTQNKLEFLRCSIGGVIYGEGITEVEREKARQNGEILPPDPTPDPTLPAGWRFASKQLMNNAWQRETNSEQISEFLMLLAVCHEARVEKQDDGSVLFPALSPDESTLVRAAKYIGFEFIERKPGKPSTVTVSRAGENIVFQILANFEFNSDRKRSSVLVRWPDGKLVLYMKGAETAIMKLLASTDTIRQITETHLQEFAAQGLRTLTLARKSVSEDFFQAWFPRYANATTDEEIEKLALEIECDVTLLGATAIEDSLQEGVGDCIRRLMEANIKIWVLTGDVTRTAIEIGYACSLIQKSTMDVLIVEFHKGDNAGELSDEQKLILVKKKLTEALQQTQKPGKEYVLVVEAAVLGYALNEEPPSSPPTQGCRDLLLAIGARCRSVICCRVSPMQKAQVTLLVKNTLKVVTLAIGDGANDVAMIQAAQIGIGIKGIEGSQAALAADYAFAQFKFLAPLLLEHGHWSYRRIATIVCYSFYKNIVFALCLFWYNIYTGFSGQNLFDDMYISCFNLFFTSLQVFGYGLFERDTNRKSLQRYPWLYIVGQKNKLFDIPRFATWICGAVCQSVIILFFTVYFHSNSASNDEGRAVGMFEIGTNVCNNVVFVVTLTMIIETRCFTLLTVGCYLVGIITWLVFLFIYHAMVPGLLGVGFDKKDNIYYVVYIIMDGCNWWFAQMFVLAACCLPQLVFHSLQSTMVLESEWVDRVRYWFYQNKKVQIPLPDAGPNATSPHTATVTPTLPKINPPEQTLTLENQFTGPEGFVKSIHRKDGGAFHTFGESSQEEMKDYTAGYNYTAPASVSGQENSYMQGKATNVDISHYLYYQQPATATQGPKVVPVPVFRAVPFEQTRTAEDFVRDQLKQQLDFIAAKPAMAFSVLRETPSHPQPLDTPSRISDSQYDQYNGAIAPPPVFQGIQMAATLDTEPIERRAFSGLVASNSDGFSPSAVRPTPPTQLTQPTSLSYPSYYPKPVPPPLSSSPSPAPSLPRDSVPVYHQLEYIPAVPASPVVPQYSQMAASGIATEYPLNAFPTPASSLPLPSPAPSNFPTYSLAPRPLRQDLHYT